jgi:hypothetical protein
MEEFNGFWKTHLEFPGGYGQKKIDAIVHNDPGAHSHTPLIATQGGFSAEVFEVEPATIGGIIDGFIELASKFTLMSTSMPPFTKIGFLPLSDYFQPPRPLVSPVGNFAGQPYDWTKSMFLLGTRLSPYHGRGPARVDPFIPGPVPNAWWIFMPIAGLVLYVSERTVADALKIAVGAVTAEKAVEYIMKMYRAAQASPRGGVLPQPVPVPAYADAPSSVPSSPQWTIGNLCNSGLCNNQGATAATSTATGLTVLELLELLLLLGVLAAA